MNWKDRCGFHVGVISLSILLTVAAGCGPRDRSSLGGGLTSEHRSVTASGITLNSGMSDEEILKQFNMNIASTEPKVAKGPDGYSTSYKAGSQSVTVTRSVVTGLYVFSDGPIKGEWRLGPER